MALLSESNPKNSRPSRGGFVGMHDVLASYSRRADEELDVAERAEVFDAAPELHSGLADRKTLADTAGARIPGNSLGNAALITQIEYTGNAPDHAGVSAAAKANSD